MTQAEMAPPVALSLSSCLQNSDFSLPLCLPAVIRWRRQTLAVAAAWRGRGGDEGAAAPSPRPSPFASQPLLGSALPGDGATGAVVAKNWSAIGGELDVVAERGWPASCCFPGALPSTGGEALPL